MKNANYTSRPSICATTLLHVRVLLTSNSSSQEKLLLISNPKSIFVRFTIFNNYIASSRFRQLSRDSREGAARVKIESE